jgi:acetyltransferase-like isoleucine patch superfamily enzyme
VQTDRIGPETRVWQFVVILPGARIGARCNICSHCFIENDVIVGDDVTVKCGVQLWDGLRVGDGVFIGPNATFTNDLFPRSGRRPERFLQTVIHAGASIGANATVLAGVAIGAGAMVGAGSVVTRDVAEGTVVAGNPAVVLSPSRS